MNKFIVQYSVWLIVIAALALLVQGDLFSLSWPVLAAQAAGLVLVFWSRAAFGKHQFRASAKPGSGPLVQTGPYRLVRHPIYAGVLLILWAAIIRRPSILNLVIGAMALIVIFWSMLNIPLEPNE